MAVPFGTVTSVVVCGALLETPAAFGVSAFLAVAAASLVAWFEQPATVKRPAAATASQSLRWTRESNISYLQRDTLGVNRRRLLVCPLRQVKLQNLRTVDIPCLYKSYKIQQTHLRCVPFPAPAYRPVEEQLTLRLDADVRFGKRLCPSADKLGFTFWME